MPKLKTNVFTREDANAPDAHASDAALAATNAPVPPDSVTSPGTSISPDPKGSPNPEGPADSPGSPDPLGSPAVPASNGVHAPAEPGSAAEASASQGDLTATTSQEAPVNGSGPASELAAAGEAPSTGSMPPLDSTSSTGEMASALQAPLPAGWADGQSADADASGAPAPATAQAQTTPPSANRANNAPAAVQAKTSARGVGSPHSLRARFTRSFLNLATGGDWAYAQSAATRRNLVWFWFDGLFASAGDNIVNTYLAIYLLALGATQTQIGMMSSLSSLTAALMLLPGALLVERIGRRREIVLAGGGLSRLVLLILALLPLFIGGPALIPVAIAVNLLRDAGNNVNYPAWMSLTADVVPLQGRGRYFASRNFIMSMMGMASTFVVGLLLTYTAQPAGYQIAFGLAFLFGAFAIFSFGHISDAQRHGPPPKPVPVVKAQAEAKPVTKPGNVLALFKEITSHGEFATFAGITALWNLSLNVAGPFFSVYLVQNLKADGTMVALTAIATSLATMLIQRKLGELNDRWGARKLTVISGLLIPLMPWAWMFIDSAWYVIPLNLFSGVMWGAYNMGSFNYLLSICPEDRRARYSALFQIVVTVSLAVGAALGSVIINQWGYLAVFGISGAGRFLTAGLFAVLSRRKQASTV